MPVLRLLHLSLALLIPALVAITWGSLLRLRGHSQQSIVMAMSRLVGKLGPYLAGTPIQVEHPEHLNPQPAVLIFNHQSGLDPVIVAALLRQPVVGVAKQQLASNPLLGPLLRLSGTLFVRRGQGWQQQLLPQASQRIAAGFSIVIAPEGTRTTPTGAAASVPGPFHLGAFAIARHCQVPLIPIVIHNSGSRLPPRSTQLQPGPVYVSVLPATYVSPQTDLQAAATEMQHRYETCLAQSVDHDHQRSQRNPPRGSDDK